MKRLLWWLIGFTSRLHLFRLSACLLLAFGYRYGLECIDPGSEAYLYNVDLPKEFKE